MFNRDLMAGATKVGKALVAGQYCYGATVPGKQELNQEQFKLWLTALWASRCEKHSTLFALETNDGSMARKRALSASAYWMEQFQESKKMAIFSTTYENARETLGGPAEENTFSKGSREQVIAHWSCGCEFHETENGSGVLFSCEKHGD